MSKMKTIIGRIMAKLIELLESSECTRCKSSSACPMDFQSLHVGTINIGKEDANNDTDGIRLSEVQRDKAQ